MRKYEFTLLNKDKVVVEAECPSLAIAKLREEYGWLYYWDLKCVR